MYGTTVDNYVFSNRAYSALFYYCYGLLLYCDVNCTDVMIQIENTPLRAKFLKLSSNYDSTQTKGLFTVISENAIPRIALYGFGDPPVLRDHHVFPVRWSTEDRKTYVRDIVESCDVIRFPVTFSRYSTPEQLPNDNDDDDDNSVFYLLLCRAIVANAQVTERPEEKMEEGYDCMYCSSTETFQIARAEHIFPVSHFAMNLCTDLLVKEFVDQCRYVKADDRVDITSTMQHLNSNKNKY